MKIIREGKSWMSVKLLGERKIKWCGILGIENSGVEFFNHYRWS
jgi:hypothetical protein